MYSNAEDKVNLLKLVEKAQSFPTSFFS